MTPHQTKPTPEQLIEEAVERWDEIEKEWDMHKKANTCSICDSPEQHTELKEFFIESLSTIASKSVERERKKIGNGWKELVGKILLWRDKHGGGINLLDVADFSKFRTLLEDQPKEEQQ